MTIIRKYRGDRIEGTSRSWARCPSCQVESSLYVLDYITTEYQFCKSETCGFYSEIFTGGAIRGLIHNHSRDEVIAFCVLEGMR